MRETVDKFRIMQLGFTIFVFKAPGVFIAHPFSAYIFPDKENHQNIVFSLKTIEFHKEHQFDFNKWIYEGLNSSETDEDSAICISSFKGVESDTELTDQDSNTKSDSDVDTERTDRISNKNASRLIEELIDFEVPIIGHNVLIDLMFIYSEFYGPLPNSFSDFKEKLLGQFPLYFIYLY